MLPPHFTQAEPPAPQLLLSAVITHAVALLQQPAHPLPVLQTQVPPEQASPGPQAGFVGPQRQPPDTQRSALLASQVAHDPPEPPQAAIVFPTSHTSPAAQQPVGQLVGVHRQAPPTHS